MSYDWRDDAACRDLGPDVMQPDHPTSRVLSIAFDACGRCPVRDWCRMDAEAPGHAAYGVWAGEWHGEDEHELTECAAERCDKTVVAVRGARFCSQACSVAERRRLEQLAGELSA